MRTRGELIFVEAVAAAVTIAACVGIAWLTYWLLDNSGVVALLAFCGSVGVAAFAYAIRSDIREGRYAFRDLPGAIFRYNKH